MLISISVETTTVLSIEICGEDHLETTTVLSRDICGGDHLETTTVLYIPSQSLQTNPRGRGGGINYKLGWSWIAYIRGNSLSRFLFTPILPQLEMVYDPGY